MIRLVRANYPEYLTHIWQDEIRDTFLLFKYGEIHHSVVSNHVKVILINRNLAKRHGHLREPSTDDGLFIFDIRINSPQLDALLGEQFGSSKRLPKNGTSVSRLKEKLGHDIIPVDHRCRRS